MNHRNTTHEALPPPYATSPDPDGVRPSLATLNLVRSQAQALLEASPAFRQLDAEQRKDIAYNLVKIGAYTAALWQDEFAQAKKLGQEPVLVKSSTKVHPSPSPSTPLSPSPPPLPSPSPSSEAAAPRPDPPMETPPDGLLRSVAQGMVPTAALAQSGPAAEEFSPRAAAAAARVTRQTLNAIAFPTFVADLIKGTFQAMVDASIQQMEAFANLLANVAKTVDQFMADNITDNQARDYLAESYPGHFRVETTDSAARVRIRNGADDRPMPSLQEDLGLSEELSSLDDDTAEELLVPAARRKLASQRHEMLSTMVLMGMQRIVITSGRIRATMGFRLDTSDKATAEKASQFDFQQKTRFKAGGGLGGLFGGPSVRHENTVAYVSSSKKESSDEINVHTDLTGEVDLKFKTDYLPLSRMAKPEMIRVIQGHTPNPEGNRPADLAGTKDP